MADKIGDGTEYIQMNTSEMYSVWMRDYDDNFLLCYCLSKGDAKIVQENMPRVDAVICSPGKTPKDRTGR